MIHRSAAPWAASALMVSRIEWYDVGWRDAATDQPPIRSTGAAAARAINQLAGAFSERWGSGTALP
jgi:hypothetical protein